MTVRGVLSSCEAAATKSFCSLQARSTGRTAQRERAMLSARKAAKPSAPMTAQVRVSPARVARSLEMSAKTHAVPARQLHAVVAQRPPRI